MTLTQVLVGVSHGQVHVRCKLGFSLGRELGLSSGRELGLSSGRELGLSSGREFGLISGWELVRLRLGVS